MTANNWRDQARRQLIGAAAPGGGFGYRANGSPAVEPTALAGLALLKSDRKRAESAARWIGSMQQPDGSIGLTKLLPGSDWAAPLAILLWAALDVEPDRRRRAVEHLLQVRGTTEPRDREGVLGHDTTLVGWPWISETHSWVEPTAMSVLALDREGKSHHPRTIEGRRLLRDRAIPGGGWNLGNSIVFNTPLRPLPGPTGLVLLALAGSRESAKLARAGIAYLEEFLPTIRASESLAWGILGLRAWRAEPNETGDWLAESYLRGADRQASPLSLALLLLAHDRDALTLLGGDASVVAATRTPRRPDPNRPGGSHPSESSTAPLTRPLWSRMA